VKILLDMNLPVQWTEFLTSAGWETIHVSSLEERPRTDAAVMDWARVNGHVVFSHGLRFGAALRCCGEKGPSVFDINAKDVMVPQLGAPVARILRQMETDLERGTIIYIDVETKRARVFKIGESDPADFPDD
jgi:predicted nuclease of predicted toxin-antitoxin system